MYAAPLGVFGAVAYTVDTSVWESSPAPETPRTMYVVLAFFIFCVLFWACPSRCGRVSPSSVSSTPSPSRHHRLRYASSEATLPSPIEQLGVLRRPREIVAFVLPTGYSFNMDGASLYQSLAYFCGQAAGCTSASPASY